jgi:hypothetical protein
MSHQDSEQYRLGSLLAFICDCCHPYDHCLRLRQSLALGSEDLMRVLLERKPSTQIFGLSAKFLEAECAIIAHENINAVVTCGIVEECYHSSGHGESREIRESRLYSGTELPEPPISFGKSFSFGSPSLMGRTVS